MMKFLFLICLLSQSLLAYVPTVESLFRNSSNPDITTNGISVTLKVKKIDGAQKTENLETEGEQYYRLFFTKNTPDSFKLAQAHYGDSTFSEASFLNKIYYPNFSSYTVKANAEEAERGLFFSALRSILFNNGSFMVSYLKALGVPVKLNNEIINRGKVELLASYKSYLFAINKDRTAKRNLSNPLKPEDALARERAENIMNEPMYVDLKQVSLSKQDGDMAWLISAGSFESVVSYAQREIQKIKLKSQIGEFEMQFKQYSFANGTHNLPKYIIFKDYKGEFYQIELSDLRHYSEREDDLIKRLKKWDTIAKPKLETNPRPPFLL